MLHRVTLWLRRTWQKLPMQLSFFGWPPLLSHSLMFILGTLVLQRGDSGLRLPNGKVLVPVDKVGKLETEGKRWKEPQKLFMLARQGEAWCRTHDEALNLWQGPGRGSELYVAWPSGGANPHRLQQALQKKVMLTADAKSYGYCGADSPVNAAPSNGVLYD